MENLLNKVWYQPERIFLVDGTPEVWQSIFGFQLTKRTLKLQESSK
jgi:hypothetical protein